MWWQRTKWWWKPLETVGNGSETALNGFQMDLVAMDQMVVDVLHPNGPGGNGPNGGGGWACVVAVWRVVQRSKKMF